MAMATAVSAARTSAEDGAALALGIVAPAAMVSGIILDVQADEAVHGDEVPQLFLVVAFRADVGEVVSGVNL